MSDWITPTGAYLQDVVKGPNHTFYIPENCGRSLANLTKLLRKNGVKPYGCMTSGGEHMLTVPFKQAASAQSVLSHFGVPCYNPHKSGVIRKGCRYVEWIVITVCVVGVICLLLFYAASMMGEV